MRQTPATTFLETAADDDTFMIQTVLQVKQGQAGIEFGLQDEAGAVLAMLAVDEGPQGLVKLTDAEGATVADRRWLLTPGREYRLRLVVVREMIEIYVDDVLAIDFFLPRLRPGQVTLVGKGDATFKTVEYRSGLTNKQAP